MNNSAYSRLGYEFEKIVADVFSIYGFKVSLTDQFHDGGYDIVADNPSIKLAIEVKISRDINAHSDIVLKAAEKVRMAAVRDNRSPMIVTASLVSQRLRENLKRYPQLIIIDIQNLLYLVNDIEKLKSKLLSVLSFSVDNILPVKPEKLFEYSLEIPNTELQQFEHFINELKEWEPERKENSKYEKLCTKVLRYLFYDDLTLWKEQCKSNDDLFRFDLICKIKNGNGKEFWKLAEKHFSTEYIIFEFKNYIDKITQKEIFTTEKYLYLKALRGVAIIVSNIGTDKNAEKAIKGILRENGKLIIALTNEDLIHMINIKANNESPSDYLSMKLDDILLDLEK